MIRYQRPIEYDFFDSILKIALVSILVVMAVDYFFTRFFVIRSLIVNSSVLAAILLAFAMRRRGYFISAVLCMGFLIIAAMFYQSLEADNITTSSMAVVMVVGFGFSILLKRRLPLLIHLVVLTGMAGIFGWIAAHPQQYGKVDASDIIVAGITYVVLYVVIAYSAWKLRQRYDQTLEMLVQANDELVSKANEIEAQNEELLQSQESLYQLNNRLESIVAVRTAEVTRQNEILLRYAYANAHHLRGPVARALGLIQLSRMDSALDCPFILQKVEEQVSEIDAVIQGINRDLQSQ
jgi:hypothetical protein